MNKEEAVKVINWCINCNTTAVTTNKLKSCEICKGPIQEIGWVEQS